MRKTAQATIIYNSRAGPTSFSDTMSLVAGWWRHRGWTVLLQSTRFPGHATILAREAATAGHHLVLAAGGDGTLSQVAAGLAHSETIMAPLAAGSANSLAKELQLPRPNLFSAEPLLAACAELVEGQVRTIDMGASCAPAAGSVTWLLWAGIGLDAVMVDAVEPRPRWSKRLGHLGYALQSLPAALTFTGMDARVTVDEQTFAGRYLLVLVANCRRYAGGELLLNPEARLDDGLFDVWLFPGRHVGRGIRYLGELLRRQIESDPDVRRLTGRTVSVHTEEPVPVQTDGEQAGETPFQGAIRPGALRMLIPRAAPQDLFGAPGIPFSGVEQALLI